MFGLVELQDIDMGPLLMPVKFPLDGIPSLKCTYCTTQLGCCILLIYHMFHALNHFRGPSLHCLQYKSTFPAVRRTK